MISSIKESWSDYTFGCWSDGSRRNVLEFVYLELRFKIASTICKHRGHKVRCTHHHATPDSGGECFECKRCGETWNIWYY